ncbi:MAG: DEAD/DEAH box helicase family protein, partial [Chloroflexota bacterium]|nr:DEAD/DEAH box helicase family protein [Chloroflexota bacterium]
MTQEASFSGFGLTKTQFFRNLSDEDLRRFLNTRVLRLLDHLFGGELAGDELRKVAGTLVDLDVTLSNPAGRRLVLSLIPAQKRAELRDRTGRDIRPQKADNWSKSELHRLRGFFGIADEEHTPPDPASLGPIEPKYALFEHQRATLDALLPLLLNDDRRAVLHLPTGAGKTRMAMHVVADFLRRHDPSLVVWLASGRELLEQASVEFRSAWEHLGNRSLRVAAMWGKETPLLADMTDGFIAVGLAKAWSYALRKDPDWASHLSAHVRLVVFDEAHQSVAPTYQQLTGDFGLNPNCSILGLTATPGRSWDDIDQNGELAAFYSENKVTLRVPDRNPVTFLIENNFLAQPHFQNLFSVPPRKRRSSRIEALVQS